MSFMEVQGLLLSLHEVSRRHSGEIDGQVFIGRMLSFWVVEEVLADAF